MVREWASGLLLPDYAIGTYSCNIGTLAAMLRTWIMTSLALLATCTMTSLFESFATGTDNN